MSAPLLICSGANCFTPGSCAIALAQASAMAKAKAGRFIRMRPFPLFGHQCKSPHRAAGGYCMSRIAIGVGAAPPRQHGHVLAALVGVSNRRGVDRRAGLEL